jgi:hypothetical protein
VTIGRGQAQVTTTLARWPNVQRDEQERVIAFSGFEPTADRAPLRARRSRDVHLVASDTLFLPRSSTGRRA